MMEIEGNRPMEEAEQIMVAVEEVKPKRTRRKKSEMIADAAVPGLPTPVAEFVETAIVAPARKKKYINNGDLMIQIALSRQQGKMTDELAKMLFMLVQRYAKHPDYTNIHSYKMDMEAFALLTIVKVWKGFNPEKGNNPFAYFTQVIRHAFYQYLNHEKKQRDTKDLIRIDMGQDPSFSFMENYREERDTDYDSGIEEADTPDTGGSRSEYDARSPGEVTEIDYSVTRGEDQPPEDNGDLSEI